LFIFRIKNFFFIIIFFNNPSRITLKRSFFLSDKFLLFEEIDWSRYFLIFVIQMFIICTFLTISYKILKRNRTRSNIFLSLFYLLISCSFILNIIYLPFREEGIVYLMYFLILYLLLLSFIFLLLFNLNLIQFEMTRSKNIIIIIVYAILAFLLLIYPGGITINESTNWKPVWSWEFLLLGYVFLTFIVVIPTFFISIKNYKKFKNEILKRKWAFFFIGLIGFAFGAYGAALYNTWNDPTFKLIWNFLTLIVVPSGILIYYGIAKDI